MYQTHKTYIHPRTRLLDCIEENPYLLLFLEHFKIDLRIGDKTAEQVCTENNISLPAFVTVANLYNGFTPEVEKLGSDNDLYSLIDFLKASHNYYKNKKYPEIKAQIDKLIEMNPRKEVMLIEVFFQDYFDEVLAHLEYEEKTAFPYFEMLINGKESENTHFSTVHYQEHHTDIETKLVDLKNLLLKHLEIENSIPVRRQLLMSLFELKYDLHIHSMVEEMILLPLVALIENPDTVG